MYFEIYGNEAITLPVASSLVDSFSCIQVRGDCEPQGTRAFSNDTCPKLGDPLRFHAHFVAVVRETSVKFADIIALGRLGKSRYRRVPSEHKCMLRTLIRELCYYRRLCRQEVRDHLLPQRGG
jgi:hypothetical protein